MRKRCAVSSFQSPVIRVLQFDLLVSARTGRPPSVGAATFRKQRGNLRRGSTVTIPLRRRFEATLPESVRRAHTDERIKRMSLPSTVAAVIEEAPEDEKTAEVEGIRLPGLIVACDRISGHCGSRGCGSHGRCGC